MVTQPNRNGTLYLERVVRHYVRCLRSVPPKLELSLPDAERDVFACMTTDAFEQLYRAFTSAPNFKAVDYASSHNSFSAGLKCYERYLRELENNENLRRGEMTMPIETTTANQASVADELNAEPLFVDFSDISAYTGTRPASCTIEGAVIPASTWASMYARICERLFVIRNRAISTMKMRTRNGDTTPLLMDAPLQGLTCAKLSNGKYLNTNYSAPSIIKLIGMICDACGIKKESIRLTYRTNMSESTPEIAVSHYSGPSDADTETAYKRWLVARGKSENTAVSYGSTLRFSIVNTFNLGHKIRANLFEYSSPEEFEPICQMLWSLPNFIAVNAKKGNSFSAALKSYSEFLKSGAVVVPSDGQPTYPAPAAAKVSVDAETAATISVLLSEHFPYGYRLDSSIELIRFRQLFADEFCDRVLPDDNGLKKLIADNGTLFNGKVYVVEKTTIERIKSEVEAAFSNGGELIFCDVFYDYHRDWLFAESIVSEAMLRSILERLYPRFSFRKNYFSPNYDSGNENFKIGQEILNAWGESVLMSHDQLAERLIYIPFDKIKTALAANDNFVWNSTGVYTHTDKFEIYDDEKAAIANCVQSRCLANGYASLSDLPLADIIERNYELSLNAIHTLVYRVCLADRYQRNNKIIFRFGDILDVLSLIREYCRTLDRCTVQELTAYETELTGEAHKPYVMQAGYETMVRIDEETYLAEHFVHFDRVAIDIAIDLLIDGDYLPLRSITTFAAFPHCGQAWNLYLLESYCWRFSDQFRLVAASVNSANIGVIVRQTCKMSLDEIMADAVANSGISLETAGALEYLCAKGYIGKRKCSKINEIIERARTARGKGD